MMLGHLIAYLVIINVQLVKFKLIIVKLVKEIDLEQLVTVQIITMKMEYHLIVLNVIINVNYVLITFVQHVQIEELIYLYVNVLMDSLII